MLGIIKQKVLQQILDKSGLRKLRIWPLTQMNFKTPKTSKIADQQSLSPRRTGQKSSLIAKKSPQALKAKASQQESAQNSLLIKLVQVQLSSQESYQNMLIQNKELEIKILQLQQESQNLKKSYKKASKPLEQIKAKIQSGRQSLVEKQKYLQKFYVHLDNKLKSNMHSNLFGKLQKIQTALEQKYENQKQALYSSLASQHEAMEAANYKLLRLKEYRDELIKQYTERAIEISYNRLMSDRYQANRHQNNRSNSNGSGKKSLNQESEKKSVHNASQKKSNQQKSSKKQSAKNSKQMLKNKLRDEHRKRNQQKKMAKIELKNECQRFKENIHKLKKQKQMAEKDEKLLKQLINIEDEHKKHSTYIISGYKKMFTIQYRQMLTSRMKSPTKAKNSPQAMKKSQKSSLQKSQQSQLHQSTVSLPDVQGLQKTLGLKVAQIEVLEREVDERNRALEVCKEKLNEEIGEYSMLEEQIMKMSNRNAGQEVGFRMTYAEIQNVENHRSTYTSYKQRSDNFDEDL